jgi:hypothetical protein
VTAAASANFSWWQAPIAFRARATTVVAVLGEQEHRFLLSNEIVNLAEILRVDGQPVASQARVSDALEIAERTGNVPKIAFAKDRVGRDAPIVSEARAH